VTSSDKLASINEPLVNLDLDLEDGSGSSRQVAVELNPEELKKLIASLEGCSKVRNSQNYCHFVRQYINTCTSVIMFKFKQVVHLVKGWTVGKRYWV
jgi:hypothetical protein